METYIFFYSSQLSFVTRKKNFEAVWLVPDDTLTIAGKNKERDRNFLGHSKARSRKLLNTAFIERSRVYYINMYRYQKKIFSVPYKEVYKEDATKYRIVQNVNRSNTRSE